jgi:SAM-dependent methyltransferase
MNLEEYFKNDIGWGDSTHGRISYEFYLKASKFAEGGVVLDVGAGHQWYKPFFENSLYLALEHEESGELAKQVRKSDILVLDNQIPLIDSSVDLVLSSASLEHFADPDEFFRESARVLKPGGAIFIHSPFIYEEHEIPFHFQHFTRYGLAHKLKMNGFVDIEIAAASSSLFAARHVLDIALEDDFPKKVHPSTFGVKILETKIHNFKRRIFGQVLDFGFYLFDRNNDHEPHEGTRMPIGYITEAKKPGILTKATFRQVDKVQFLQEKMLDDQRFDFSNGAIRFKNGQDKQ